MLLSYRNQLTSFYTRATLALNRLIRTTINFCSIHIQKTIQIKKFPFSSILSVGISLVVVVQDLLSGSETKFN